MITEWLDENNSSNDNTKIFIEYIQEGMTSIHQVRDISINKPVKALVKKQYFQFRYEPIKEKTVEDLAGKVLTVSRKI